jgi:hypothetical protein
MNHLPFAMLRTGWNRILDPRSYLAVDALVSLATERDIEGGLDTIAAAEPELFAEDGAFGTLDDPIVWIEPAAAEDPEEVASLQLREAQFEAAVQVLGRPVPTTTRELAILLADLGVFERQNAGSATERWRMPVDIPTPGEVLPLPKDVIDREDGIRWRSIHGPNASKVIRHVIDTLGQPDKVNATLEELASALEMTVPDCREALAILLSDGDFTLVDRADGTPAAPELVSPTAPLTLHIDWELFSENRIQIGWAEDDDAQ